MEFSCKRGYRGTVKGVIFDWAGTTVDFGCQAPAMVFKQVFREEGVEITDKEARAPMGLHKRDHIRSISRMTRVAKEWQKVHGQACSEDDVERMFNQFIPRQIGLLPEYSELVPHVVEAQEMLHKHNIKIGTTTGYNSAMMEILTPLACKQGYMPDAVVCATDVPAARPAPWMAFKNAMDLNIYPMASIIKIGDTIADIDEGINAGMWSVGVVLTSNELALTQQEVNEMPEDELEARCASVKEKMYKAGAHFVMQSLDQTEELIDSVNDLLLKGIHP